MSEVSPLQTFRKELLGNPRKAAILAVLLAVGFSIWIPQMARMVNGPRSFAIPSVPPTVPAAESAGTAVPTSSDPLDSWQQLTAWIEQGEHFRPVAPPADLVSPFRGVPESSEPEAEIVPIIDPQPSVTEPLPVPEPVVAEILPAPEDLVLKSTMQGTKSRGAFINDQYYREGEVIRTSSADYVISQVEPRRVILKSGGQSYELLIPSVLPRSQNSPPVPSPATSGPSL